MSDNDKAPIDFWFDFSSPYGYLLSERIDEVAARFGRKVRWHPILLGVVFNATGSAPLTSQNPAKAAYSVLTASRLPSNSAPMLAGRGKYNMAQIRIEIAKIAVPARMVNALDASQTRCQTTLIVGHL